MRQSPLRICTNIIGNFYKDLKLQFVHKIIYFIFINKLLTNKVYLIYKIIIIKNLIIYNT